MNKRAQWQNYLLPAIMAILVLGISFYFIFNEYFTSEDIDRDVCRQSVMVRSSLPEVDVVGTTPISFKKQFPLKCKTNVIDITSDDVKEKRVDNIIGDALVECWYIFGSGDGDVFPASVFGKTTSCIPCARIHFTNEAKKMINDSKELKGKIDIEGLLNGAKFDDKFFYLNYLKGVGKLFEPFNPAFNNPFDLGGDKFKIGGWSGSSVKKIKDGSEIKMSGEFGSISLPKYLDIDKGDLIIVLGQLTDSGSDDAANYVPYMFYFQNGQEDYLKEMDKRLFFSGGRNDMICNSWEGIPA